MATLNPQPPLRPILPAPLSTALLCSKCSPPNTSPEESLLPPLSARIPASWAVFHTWGTCIPAHMQPCGPSVSSTGLRPCPLNSLPEPLLPLPASVSVCFSVYACVLHTCVSASCCRWWPVYLSTWVVLLQRCELPHSADHSTPHTECTFFMLA